MTLKLFSQFAKSRIFLSALVVAMAGTGVTIVDPLWAGINGAYDNDGAGPAKGDPGGVGQKEGSSNNNPSDNSGSSGGSGGAMSDTAIKEQLHSIIDMENAVALEACTSTCTVRDINGKEIWTVRGDDPADVRRVVASAYFAASFSFKPGQSAKDRSNLVAREITNILDNEAKVDAVQPSYLLENIAINFAGGLAGLFGKQAVGALSKTGIAEFTQMVGRFIARTGIDKIVGNIYRGPATEIEVLMNSRPIFSRGAPQDVIKNATNHFRIHAPRIEAMTGLKVDTVQTYMRLGETSVKSRQAETITFYDPVSSTFARLNKDGTVVWGKIEGTTVTVTTVYQSPGLPNTWVPDMVIGAQPIQGYLTSDGKFRLSEVKLADRK